MRFLDDPMTLECSLPYPKTLDKNILAIRAREMQEVVPEDGVHENIVDITTSSHMMEVTDSVVEMEAALLDLQHNTEHNGDGSQTEVAQEEGLALPANKEDKVIVVNQSGSGGSSSLASPAAGGNEDGGQAQQKKQKKRSKTWTAEETDVLLLQVVSQKHKIEGTSSGMLYQYQWEAISQEVHGRTWKECRDKMDTLKGSYRSIKKYCDTNEKEFEELKEKDFQAMGRKQSPCFKEDWYNQIRDHCPPTPKKRRSEVADSVPNLWKMGSGFGSCTLMLGNTFGGRGDQHPEAGPNNVVVTTPGGIDSTLAAFESTAKLPSSSNMSSWCHLRGLHIMETYKAERGARIMVKVVVEQNQGALATGMDAAWRS